MLFAFDIFFNFPTFMDSALLAQYQKKKRSYLANYWHHVLLSAVPVVAVFAYITHLSYQSVLQQVRDNWVTKRCSPIYLPFAGLIMPQPGQSAVTTTIENFDYCIQQDFSAIISVFLLPLEFVAYMVLDVLEAIANTLLALVAFFNYLKEQTSGQSGKILEKVGNLVGALSVNVVKIRDSLAKVNGVLVASLFTSMTIYKVVVSGLVNVMVIITDLLIATISIILLMFYLGYFYIITPNPYSFELGVAIIAIAVSLTLVVIPIIVFYALLKPFMAQVLNAATPNTQSVPSPNKKKK
jgi:hypothetical protein